MGYRDDKEALRAQNEALKARVSELEAEKKARTQQAKARAKDGGRARSARSPKQRKGLALGNIYYQPPHFQGAEIRTESATVQLSQ